MNLIINHSDLSKTVGGIRFPCFNLESCTGISQALLNDLDIKNYIRGLSRNFERFDLATYNQASHDLHLNMIHDVDQK